MIAQCRLNSQTSHSVLAGDGTVLLATRSMLCLPSLLLNRHTLTHQGDRAGGAAEVWWIGRQEGRGTAPGRAGCALAQPLSCLRGGSSRS